MSFTDNQRKGYLLAIALMVIAIALVCGWMLRPEQKTESAFIAPAPEASVSPSTQESPAPDVSASPTEDASSASAQTGKAAEKAGKVSTIVYYQDNDGYLVPVMCSVPLEDGIAKATLSMMVQSVGNDMQAARLGLRTVLPENTTIDLDIAGGLARIDLSREVLALPDAAAESNMISAVVGTLTEFDTVKEVEFLFGGQKLEKLPNGTSVSGRFTRGSINTEMAEDVMGAANVSPVTLYFPSEAGAVVVPVTRMVYSSPDLNTAVLELTKGPSSACSLENVLPAGCGLIDVKVENGVAKLNFTKEFAEIALNNDGGRLALKALVLTCTQFDGVDSVEIYVEGEKYDPGKDTLSVPTFANVADSIVYDYLQTQSAMLVDE